MIFNLSSIISHSSYKPIYMIWYCFFFTEMQLMKITSSFKSAILQKRHCVYCNAFNVYLLLHPNYTEFYRCNQSRVSFKFLDFPWPQFNTDPKQNWVLYWTITMYKLSICERRMQGANSKESFMVFERRNNK